MGLKRLIKLKKLLSTSKIKTKTRKIVRLIKKELKKIGKYGNGSKKM